MKVETVYQHIVQTPDIVGGKPRIAGHRITVQNIVIWHEHMGYSVDEIATQYNLTLAEIYSALAYYYDHKQQIDESIKESESFVESMRQKTPSLLAQKLYERAG
ncbi:MAG: DUF433 domain-containing protein [Chloroflexi bacterium]|nr:DUF433 domain-containing protein [Chloroflexota bacterium]MCI0648344.1 DUF433 domain-containing protein [Chloroflexota bacterium]MCI0729672.1 DUF433 domain-containing protein [Chloroflexota bacterium]